MILGQEIMQLTSLARITLRNDSQAGELGVPHQALSSHDQGINNRFRYTGKFSERAAQIILWHLKNLNLFGFHSSVGERRSALKHGYITDKIAFAGSAKNLLAIFALLEDLDFAAQNHG